MMNFTIQDITGIFIALLLYSFVFVFPGHVAGWVLNLFDFRQRTSIVQLVMAMAISISIVPAILFLIYRFSSFNLVLSILLFLCVASTYIFIKFYKPSLKDNVYQRLALFFIALWVVLSVITVSDLQIAERLYFSSNSYDLTTRVSVTNAITRTGVPPVNPSYYPGQPVLLNSLYYYWYILASIVDQMGGTWVSAYQAMLASISWAGILLFATLATYLRIRDGQAGKNAWKKSFLGIQLFVIGGLDIIMVMIIISNFYFRLGELPFQGQLEGWNMPIMSWMNALAWVPHHLAAALACVIALLISVYDMDRKYVDRIAASVIVGLAFASAFGLSVWVMFVFAIFWLVWGGSLIFEKKYQQIVFMIFSGIYALIFVSPFLLGIISDGSGSPASSNLPLALYIRPFMIISLLPDFHPTILNILNLIFLPMNYLFELGFFFLMGILWIQEIYKQKKETSSIYKAEFILVVTTILVLSFIYSNIIVINDLGIRGWLPLQFILVIWSADIIYKFCYSSKWLSLKMFEGIQGTKTLKIILASTMIIGMFTMASEFLVLRTWHILMGANPENNTPIWLNPDGARIYSARLAYKYIDTSLPTNLIIQNNPSGFLDRPIGLYGMRQSAISDRTAYGIPQEIYLSKVEEVSQIFKMENLQDWHPVDELCNKHFIDILIITTTDNLWDELTLLNKQRSSLYKDDYYAVFACGNYHASLPMP